MSGEVRKGDVCVSENGTVVLVTRINVRSESPDNEGRIHTYHTSSVLRANTVPVGSRYAGKTFRVVCQIEDLLCIGEKAGLDLTTPAIVRDSELSELELLKRKVAQLESQVTRECYRTSNAGSWIVRNGRCIIER
jgi:hypothetical protein